MREVVMQAYHRSLNPGERAGFSDAEAADMVKKGLARYYTKPADVPEAKLEPSTAAAGAPASDPEEARAPAIEQLAEPSLTPDVKPPEAKPGLFRRGKR